jgi:hypothetical protein
VPAVEREKILASLSPQRGEGRVRGESGSCVWKRENAHLYVAETLVFEIR